MIEAIKKYCSKQGISISDVEKALGFSNSAIYRWDVNAPSVEKVRRVADYLGVTVNDLLDYDDGTDPELVLALKAAEERPELRVLFSLGSKATKEDVEAVIRLLSR